MRPYDEGDNKGTEMLTDCQFNEERHEYRIAGRIVPSVTQVLADLIPGWRAADWYLTRGQAVHACAAMVARGEDFDFDPEISGQVAGLRRFFAEVQPLVCAIEKQVYSVRYRYAGTMDLLTQKPQSVYAMILDFKSCLGPSVPFQCAAYAMAYEEMNRPERVRWGVGVEIREDGGYRMGQIADLTLYKAKFLALLSAYNSRRECGIKEDDK